MNAFAGKTSTVFFTASGQKPFTQRIIVTTTNDWTENAENALSNQQPPVYKIDLHDLENSQIDWSKYQPSATPVLKPKYPLKPHQTSACTNVLLNFKSADRSKLIMACGTGKTFTSLKIAEEVAGKNKLVLFLVPSLNLLSQTLTEAHRTTGATFESEDESTFVKIHNNGYIRAAKGRAGFVMANSTTKVYSCTMKTTEGVRRHAAELGMANEEVLKLGVEEKSKEFVEQGAEVCAKA